MDDIASVPDQRVRYANGFWYQTVRKTGTPKPCTELGRAGFGALDSNTRDCIVTPSGHAHMIPHVMKNVSFKVDRTFENCALLHLLEAP